MHGTCYIDHLLPVVANSAVDSDRVIFKNGHGVRFPTNESGPTGNSVGL